MIQEHANAFLVLLNAVDVPVPPLVVFDGRVPSGTVPPYVLVYFLVESPEDSGSRPLTATTADRLVCRALCHCVGADAVAARAVAARARGALLDVVPTITGRVCYPIRQEQSIPPTRDESTGALVMDQVDVYRLESVPG